MENEQNNYMAKAISAAIEKGGYDSNPAGYNKLSAESPRYTDAQRNSCILDPLFWQALGKALGWKTWRCSNCNAWINRQKPNVGVEKNNLVHWTCSAPGVGCFQPEWEIAAHKYLDVVLTGGDTEKFWKELLKQ